MDLIGVVHKGTLSSHKFYTWHIGAVGLLPLSLFIFTSLLVQNLSLMGRFLGTGFWSCWYPLFMRGWRKSGISLNWWQFFCPLENPFRLVYRIGDPIFLLLACFCTIIYELLSLPLSFHLSITPNSWVVVWIRYLLYLQQTTIINSIIHLTCLG